MSEVMEFKTEGWKRHNFLDNELMNYQGYTDENKNMVAIFDSPAELVRAVNFNNERFGGNGTWKGGSTNTSDWVNGEYKNNAASIKAINDGSVLPKYIDVVDRCKEDLFKRLPQLERLEKSAISKRKRRKFSEDGSELDIDRYMSGDPEMWQQTFKQDVRKKTARIHFELPTSSATGFEEFVKAMGYSMALADIIEKAGINIEVTIGYSSVNAQIGMNINTVVTIAKHSNEPLDIQKLLSVGISAYLRLFGFSGWASICGGVARTTSGSYGHCISRLEDMRKVIEFINPDVAFMFTGRLSDGTVQSMVSSIENLLNLNNEVINTTW